MIEVDVEPIASVTTRPPSLPPRPRLPVHLRQAIHPARRPDLLVAAVLFVLLLATAGRYGWFRDELYFLQAGQHPAWGYPDQPLFTPWVVAAVHDLSGGHLVAVRATAALASSAAVVLSAAVATAAGGGPRARLIAALVWATGGWALNTGHFVVTGSFDVPLTLAMCWCLLRAVSTGRTVWMAAAGAALGLGLLNKFTIGMVAGCLLLALLAIGPRRLLISWWTALGALLAVAGAAPYLGWQAVHGWPQQDLARSIATVPENDLLGVLWSQCTLAAPALVPVLVLGAHRLARSRSARPYRFFLLAYLLLLVCLVATHGRGYYTAGLGAVLFAVGAVALERWWSAAGSRARAGGSRWPIRSAAVALGVALVASFTVNALHALPLVPERQLAASGLNRANGLLGDQVGWPRLVASVAGVRARIPAPDRAGAVVLTANYGQAGAVDLFGPALGLPRAYSGHNGYARWGAPPGAAGPVILVGFAPTSDVAGYFTRCRQEALVENDLRLDNVERGMPVLLCAAPREPWNRLWPRLVHDDLGVTLTAEEKATNLRSAGCDVRDCR